MEMTVRGKPGKPNPGFPPFPPPLEIAAAIPTFPPLRRLILYKGEAKTASPKNQQLRVGQIKPPKWAKCTCQTHSRSNCGGPSLEQTTARVRLEVDRAEVLKLAPELLAVFFQSHSH